VAICYFGEGAASEGDFHPALNFAATLKCPVIFFCRNNGYAISTPVTEQYAGDGIAGRGPGYGIDSIRVDGNDLLAVYNVTKDARKRVMETQRPVLIEAMTYRLGHHSTSDDSSRYRSMAEVAHWQKRNNPITRVKKYLIKKGYWSEEEDKVFQETNKKEVLDALKKAEQIHKPPIRDLFTDVYDQLTPALIAQRAELAEHLKKYPHDYPIEEYAPLPLIDDSK